jgi:S-adenosylmethionine-dependent methyltransferase
VGWGLSVQMTIVANNERFESGAKEYAAYLETPEGRLRSDLAFANLEEVLPRPEPATELRALDVGCGTGAAGVRLARLGFQVTLLDSSRSMLDLAQRAAEQARVADKINLQAGDASQLESLFDPVSFDVIVCHNVLEFVDEPMTLLRSVALVMRNSSSILSLLVRNRAGEVFKAALLTGDLEAAETNLKSEWGQESLYGGKVRLFTPHSLQDMLKSASMATMAERGVRVLTDYLPPKISRNGDYVRIFELERKLGKLSEYAAVARYTQFLARRLDDKKRWSELAGNKT